ncbi:MAG: PspC domain-containing protein [Firmicutes bacterium]|nr:PspC domain-containing protein [Bacillota bacterium]MBQ2059522.1 PspC domain-containing protein [Bacillota bacterium]
MQKKLYRSERNKAIWGVCGGLGEYFGVDPIIVRLIFVLLFLTYGMGLTFYVVCALVIPKEPTGPIEADYTVGGGSDSYSSSDSYTGADDSYGDYRDGYRGATSYDGSGAGESGEGRSFRESAAKAEEKIAGKAEELKDRIKAGDVGAILIVIGVILVLRVFFPRISLRLLLGVLAIGFGIYALRK